MIQATCKHAGGKLCDREDPCSPLCQGEFISKNVLKWYLFMTVSKCHVMRLPKNLIFNSEYVLRRSLMKRSENTERSRRK